MKKLVALLLTLSLLLALAACGGGNGNETQSEAPANSEAVTDTEPTAASEGGGEESQAPSGDGAEIGLVTDIGTIDDKSFNQGSWEGVKQYAEEKNISYQYYQPTDTDEDTLKAFIALAISNGAKVVVCPGFIFEPVIYDLQKEYPDISFVLIDGEPHDADYVYETTSNTYPILYEEDQAGFLAGYAAVKEGFTKLGFMGGMAVPAVKKFGLGYVQGAEYAAAELGVNVSIMYHYTGGFAATPEAQTMAAGWYSTGVEVIFGCGGAVGNSVMSAAQDADAKVIGVDVDQSGESPTVITSAMKNLKKSVYDALTDIYNGVAGGETKVLDAAVAGIQLPDDFSRFENFTKEDYDEIYAKIVSGEVVVDSTFTAENNPDSNDPGDVLKGLVQTSVTFVA